MKTASFPATPDTLACRFLRHAALIVVAVTLSVAAVSPAAAQAWVQTDKSDYLPGDFVEIAGGGFEAGEVVTLQVTHIDGTPEGGAGHEPWTIVANSPGGDFTSRWFLDLDDSLGSTFLLTAVGESGLTASTTFTDAGQPDIQNLWQCDPPTGYNPATYTCVTSGATGWVTGNDDGPFTEGQTVPYRTRLQNLVASNDYSITIEWDTTKSGKHALDYLKTWNATITAANPCLSLAGLPAGLCSGAPSTLPIPADTVMQASADWIANSGVQDPGVFSMFGGTITSVSAYTTPPNYLGDTETSITIYFTANSTDIVIAWGGHIAERDDWGLDNAAATISGSPYHMRIPSWRDETADQNLNVGNFDRSLSSEAVIYPASITIIKEAIPQGNTEFPFVASPAPLSNFSLVDDGSSTDTRVFSGITSFTTYTVTENTPADWDLDLVACTVTSANGGSQTVAIPTVTIALKEGENVTCTFTNCDCDDGNACTEDSCDLATGQCINTGTTCDDGDACTTDSCDAETGQCSYTPISCDDGNACTVDSCDTATGCVNTDSSAACDDGSACTDDSCNPASGCVYTPITCNDNSECTTDTCNPASGCVYTPITCNDNSECTADTCNPASGCVYTDISASCNDGNVCTIDSCNAATGCVNTPGNAGTVCRPLAEGAACDVVERCDGVHAACPTDLNFGDECNQVTDTSFCQLPTWNDTCSPGQFRLIYLQDPQVTTSGTNFNSYRMNASNPGQFYDNIFVNGTPGSTETLDIVVPYPFVTQGAVPIQAHDGVTLNSAGCFVPSPSLSGCTISTDGGNVSSSGAPVILIGDYDPQNIGATTHVTVSCTVPASGLLYVTIHLDDGLKKTTGWAKTDPVDLASHAAFVDGDGQVDVSDCQPYTFSFADGTSDSTTVYSTNEFKKNPGVNGLTLQKGTGNPKANVKVELWGPTNKLVLSAVTDQDGVYVLNYKHTGKAATYKVKVPTYGLQQSVTLKANGYAIVIFDTLP